MDKILIMLFALILEAAGVALMSKGLRRIRVNEGRGRGAVLRAVSRGVRDRDIVVGVLLQAGFFAIFARLLASHDMSLVWPLTSLGFVITTLTAKLYLKEQVSPLRWAGVLLIVIGAVIVGWSEQHATLDLAGAGAESAPAAMVRHAPADSP